MEAEALVGLARHKLAILQQLALDRRALAGRGQRLRFGRAIDFEGWQRAALRQSKT